ncbi:MBOAT family protein [Trichinella nativa]|uniref:diacylglycerol O-acyltransferase n=1 Tax=Trichinella nativa TaxID=6335 RepID=A0A1Y3E3C3_9BILA|nr:MBOAT family protein [Trichinella nativa]
MSDGSKKVDAGTKTSNGRWNSSPDRPCHIAEDSLLCSSNTLTNYRGFFTFSMILLVLSNLRVALENFIKYGLLINHKKILLDYVAHVNTFPVILVLLLISYAHVNYWCRCDYFLKAKGGVTDFAPNANSSSHKSYPANLTIFNLYYFILAPTLCYELNYPRTKKIRKTFLLKRFLEVLFLPQVVFALCQQWIYPLMMNAVEPLKMMDYSRMLERMLKLAVPNIIIWLINFYFLFHSFLNFLGELLYFGDRGFYRDWWNAETSQYFWKSWNIPVHRWCLRHLYIPLLSRGYSKSFSNLLVFIVSAFFHEYLISIPMHIFRIWMFAGMLAQIPLNVLTTAVPKSHRIWGNFLVWLSIILGQPLIILMYFHDWYVDHQISRMTLASAKSATCVPNEPFVKFKP